MATENGTQNPGDDQQQQQSQGGNGGQQQQQSQGAKPGDTGDKGQQQQATKFEYAEDRSTWLPKHRYDEVAGKLTKAEQEALRLKQELETEQKRVRAAMGIETPKPEEAEAAALRQALTQLFPGLEKLLDGKTFEQLEAMMEKAERAEAAANNHFERLAQGMVDDLKSEVEDLLGGDLTERQFVQLKRAYRDAANDAVAAREANPDADHSNDFLSRHGRGDKKLLQEFAKEFVEDWLTIARRKVTTQVAPRMRPTPRGGQSRPVTTQRPQVDLSKADAFADALVKARQDEGGGF